MKQSLAFNRAIISDILLWIALAVLLAAGIWFFTIKLPENRGAKITVHFQDANEITRGAIVRMMGTEIGYVDDIKLKQDHIDVIIRTYPDSLPVPSGSLFTVQFTGLVGSKSIEVVPPEIPRPTIQGQPLYLVEEPIRLKDMQKYQLDITQDLQRGAENIADFFGKKKSVEELQINIAAFHIGTLDTVVFLDEVSSKITTIDADLAASMLEGSQTLEQFAPAMRTAVRTTQPATLSLKFHKTLGFFKRLNNLMIAEGQTAANTSRLQEKLSRLNIINVRLSERLINTQAWIAGFPLVDYLDAFIGREQKFYNWVTRADRFMMRDHLTTWKNARPRIQRFNQTLETLSQKAEVLHQKKAIRPYASQASSAAPPADISTLPPAEDRVISSQGIIPIKPTVESIPALPPPVQPPKKQTYFFGLSGCSSSK